MLVGVQIAVGLTISGIEVTSFTCLLQVSGGDTSLLGRASAAQTTMYALGSIIAGTLLDTVVGSSYNTVFLVTALLRGGVAVVVSYADPTNLNESEQLLTDRKEVDYCTV